MSIQDAVILAPGTIAMNTVSVAYDHLRIALLEDDALLRDRVLIPRLAEYGFAVTGFPTAADLYAHLESELPEIVILDVGLPDQDGFSVARQLRARFPGVGVVMLTALSETADRIRGLSDGADAYLSKPVEVALLAATLHGVARRILYAIGNTPESSHWRLDIDGWCLLSPSGQSVALTATERRVLTRLVSAPGRLVTREQLIAAMTTNVYDFDPHRLDSLIHRLRKKVASACGEALPLIAVPGEGYIFKRSRG
jgi:DNA-binding response OmpR family regulator